MADRAQITNDMRDAVDKAVMDAISEHGGLFQGYVASVMYLDPDGEPSWGLLVPDDQRNITTLGLLRQAEIMVEQSIREG